jgi:hypothetical protein
MWMKPVMTLLLALVFQLAQVLPSTAAPGPCTPTGGGCECCDPLESCPCAENDETRHNNLPLAPESGNTLKISAAKPSTTRVTPESFPTTRLSATVVEPPVCDLMSGYTGVRLSVAFCSFVI